jgi:hypothetical protein
MIVFCITCKGRTQHLKQTLLANLADNFGSYPNCKFVVLDYNSQDGLVEWLSVWWNRPVVYSYRDPGPFRMAHAKNMAHRLGILEGGDILVNLDADNFTGHGFAKYIADQFIRPYGPRSDIFLYSTMVKEGPDRTDRGISGRIAVTVPAFLKTGGYDEQFSTWSPDDKDFNMRLRRLGYEGVEIDRRYLHAVRHTDKMRFKEYPHAATETAEDQFETVHSSETTVANFGNFGCGTVYKNFGDTRTVLAPLPTRIFGIGMHKTATTSLHTALQILGYDSAHWKSAHWAKAIYEEMVTWGRSHTLERHYAMCDLPFTLLYKELDKAYPGSKFILTIRSEARWLYSVSRHWSPEFNQFRGAWNTDPFTHRIHKLVYGQKGFDPEIFLTRYRRHNAEVLEYFKGREEDLLVMDMDKGAGWGELCTFLGRPVPGKPYPKEFTTEEQ